MDEIEGYVCQISPLIIAIYKDTVEYIPCLSNGTFTIGEFVKIKGVYKEKPYEEFGIMRNLKLFESM